ncbi:MAG: hypothetical protein IH588_02745 [Anaerolineales bacterium]|nr:hypothetical protein [Anaerolineales bacterium]
MLKRIIESSRLEIFIAAMIALASITTALVTWRASMAGSQAGDAIRQGLIDAVKQQASTNEEGGYAQTYAATLAQIEAFEKSGVSTAEAQAKNLRQYLLPSLQLFSTNLTTDPKYLKSDGTYDLEQRFAELQAQSPNSSLDPEASFKAADLYGAEQRWLTMDIVLLAISLFWLAFAELNTGRSRFFTLLIGVGLYLISLTWFGVVEIAFLAIRGGAL